MTQQRAELWSIAALSVLVAVAMIVAVMYFSCLENRQSKIISIVEVNAARLDALEHNKAKATARRFTADDYLALAQCLRIPYKERDACLDEIAVRISNR